jgi:UDP-3-O-[3-hydroxymyristoyl] glucosamine N-acyltransferase
MPSSSGSTSIPSPRSPAAAHPPAAPRLTSGRIAEILRGQLRGRADLPIDGVNALEAASDGEITFLADAAHAGRWASARAAAAVVTAGLEPAGHDPRTRALIVVPSAALAMVNVLGLFAPPAPRPDAGIHPAAWVHGEATVGRGACIGPHVTVDRGAVIGERAVLHSGVRIYAHAVVGDDAVLHANTVVRERCRIGRRAVLHQNVSIGADGFGYEPAPDGHGLLKVPQIGTVVIEDDCEIGAGTCIDRAKFGATVIGTGTKIDNLVQIGHNCRIGRDCVIAALSGLAGSVTLGDGVQVAGAVGIADHVSVGAGARIGAHSGVMRDIPAGMVALGSPAEDMKRTLRQIAAVRKLPEWMRILSRLVKGDEGPA